MRELASSPRETTAPHPPPRTAQLGAAVDGLSAGALGLIGLEHRRIWLILVLDACERAGLAPVPSARLHRFAFFANCMAPVYDLPAEDGKILKYRRGPFYPDLQWDLDRLWVMGLLERRGAELLKDKFGAWFRAEYGLTASGVAAIAVILESPRQQQVAAFLADLAAAYAGLDERARDKAALVDATYGDPNVHLNALIDFGEWMRSEDENRSVATADAFNRHAPEGLTLGRRDRLHLYFRLLERRAGGSPGLPATERATPRAAALKSRRTG